MRAALAVAMLILLGGCGFGLAWLFRGGERTVAVRDGQVRLVLDRGTDVLTGNGASKLLFEVGGKPRAEVDLLQSFFEGPIGIVATGNDNTVLCLFDFDTSQELLVIDFDAPAEARLDLPEALKPLIRRRGNQAIQAANKTDVDEAARLIREMSDSAIRDAFAAPWRVTLGLTGMRESALDVLTRVFPYAGAERWAPNRIGETRLR